MLRDVRCTSIARYVYAVFVFARCAVVTCVASVSRGLCVTICVCYGCASLFATSCEFVVKVLLDMRMLCLCLRYVLL